MDFSWPEENLSFKETVKKFARKELNHDLVNREQKGEFSHENWLKCADFGIQGLAAPAKYGGQQEEIDFMRAMLAMEAMGYGCHDSGLNLGLNAQMWTVQLPLLEFGNEQQKEKYLPSLISGKKICSHALTEPEAGSDVFSMKMSARKVTDGYLLNGTKCLITMAPVADMSLIFASTNPKMGKWGISAFLVEKEMRGYAATDVQSKMGMRTVPIGELVLQDCFVPEENRLGAEGAGFSIINHSLEYDRCCILASQLGTMERQLEENIEYVKTREQFGQSIGKFQSVSNRIANMKLRLETSRLLLYKVAWLKHHGHSATMEAAMLKLQLGESFVESSMDTIRNHGGIGYLTDFGVERDLRDSIGGVLYAGTSDIQRNIIAKMLGLG